MPRQSLRAEQRRGTPGKIAQECVESVFETRVGFGRVVSHFQLFERSHQGFRHVLSAKGAVASARAGRFFETGWLRHCTSLDASSTARTNSSMRIGSFFPGLFSTPLQTSTAYGWAPPIAAPTFSGGGPPATKIGPYLLERRAIAQLNVFPVPPRRVAE